MEDAMILNRAGIHRGLARGTVYKNETIDLRRRNPPAFLGIDPNPPQQRFRGGFARAADSEERPKTIFGQKFPQNEPAKVRSPTFCNGSAAVCCMQVKSCMRSRTILEAVACHDHFFSISCAMLCPTRKLLLLKGTGCGECALEMQTCVCEASPCIVAADGTCSLPDLHSQCCQ